MTTTTAPRQEESSVLPFQKDIVAILQHYLDLSRYRVFLFGSRARGTARARSDFDVGIEGTDPIPAKTRVMIQEEIERLPTLYKIEIVDFANVSKNFRNVALQKTKQLIP